MTKELLKEDTLMLGVAPVETSYASSMDDVLNTMSEIPAEEVSVEINTEEVPTENQAESDLDSIINRIMERLMAIFWTTKFAHWNAEDWGAHLGYDKVHDDIGDFIDKLAETYYMANATKVMPSMFPDLLNMMEWPFAEVIDTLNGDISIACGLTDNEGLKSLLSGISESLTAKKGFTRLSQSDDKDASLVTISDDETAKEYKDFINALSGNTETMTKIKPVEDETSIDDALSELACCL